MADSSEDLAERATDLQQLAITDPSEVSLGDLREVISTPAVALVQLRSVTKSDPDEKVRELAPWVINEMS